MFAGLGGETAKLSTKSTGTLIAEIYGVVRPEALDQMIAQYRGLSAQGKPGAEVMWFCLERRRMALVGDSRHQVAEVLG